MRIKYEVKGYLDDDSLHDFTMNLFSLSELPMLVSKKGIQGFFF